MHADESAMESPHVGNSSRVCDISNARNEILHRGHLPPTGIAQAPRSSLPVCLALYPDL